MRGMVEDAKTQNEVLRTGKVDTIISEPIGVILLHERMVSPATSPIPCAPTLT